MHSANSKVHSPAWSDTSISIRIARSAWVWTAGLFLAASIGIWLTRDYVMDDAFITLRYSRHLAEFGRASWNVGPNEPLSLGYTSILWMLVHAIVAKVFVSPDALPIAAKVIATGALLGICATFARELTTSRVPTPSKVLVAFLIFAHFGWGFHVNSAMETMLASYFALVAVRAAGREPRVRAYVAGLLAFLTRPELILVTVAIAVFDAFDRKKNGRKVLLFGGSIQAIGIAITIALLWHFYGTPLPNAFFVKQSAHVISYLGVLHNLLFVTLVALPALATCAYVAIRFRDLTARIALATSLLVVAYFCTVHPLMNIAHRYVWPAYVVLAYATVVSLERMRMTKAWPLLVAAWVISSARLSALGFVHAHYDAAMVRSYKRLAHALKEAQPAQSGLNSLALQDVGVVAYYSEWTVLDTGGLADRRLSHGAKIASVVCDVQPALLLLTRGFPATHEEEEIYDRQFNDYTRCGYSPRGTVPLDAFDDARLEWAVFAKAQSDATALADRAIANATIDVYRKRLPRVLERIGYENPFSEL